MIKNYIKTTIRNILRQKGYSFITIFSLTIGIAAFLMISLWIYTELSYDKFYHNSNNLYQVLGQGSKFKNFESLPQLLAPVLQQDIPEIIYASRYENQAEVLLKHNDLSFYESGIIKVDNTFFDIFKFGFLQGVRQMALKGPDSIVITKKIADKYFPHENPMGKILTIDNKYDFKITGVIEDIAFNSSLQFKMVILFENITSTRALSWDNFAPKVFIQLHENSSTGDINNKLANFVEKHQSGSKLGLSILPFKERHLFFSDIKKYIYLFFAIGILILIIASVNFINLSTVRSINRAREIGIRKVLGAFRKNIIFQFLGESLILAVIAIFLVLISLGPLLRIFTNLTGKTILLNNLFVILIIGFVTLISGIFAGIYPAFFIANFQPTEVLKGKVQGRRKSHVLRNALIVFQFSISVILIIGAKGIFTQLNHMKDMDVGYQREHVIQIPFKGESLNFYSVFKNDLNLDQRIQSVSGSIAGMPYFGWTTGGIDWDGKDKDQKVFVNFNYIDYDFFKTMMIRIKEGRVFSKAYPSDTKNYIINEEMAGVMGFTSPLGETIRLWDKPGEIIGVVKNFNHETLEKKIEPLILLLRPNNIEFALVKIKPQGISSTIQYIRKTWDRILPAYPFKYEFLDNEFNSKYLNIEKIGKLVNVFSALAVFISCLGLFGLASFNTEERRKEVGIRKTLGSTSWKIVFLFTKDFIKWVIIANLIAWPIAWYVMHKWLQNFAYHINLTIWSFLLAGVLVFMISIFAVGYQTIKAAIANPIDSLRYE